MNEETNVGMDETAYEDFFGSFGNQTEDAEETETEVETADESADEPVSEENADGTDAGEGAENGAETNQEAEGANKTEDAEQLFEYKVNKETKSLNLKNPEHLAELKTLAQKGADYDRVKGQLAEARGFKETYGQVAEVLESVAKANNTTVAEIVTQFRTNMLRGTGLSEDAARERIGREDAERELQALKDAEAAKQTAETDTAERAKREFGEFRGKFPDVLLDKPTLDALAPMIQSGKTLTEAYLEHKANTAAAENERLKQELAAAKQTQKNKTRSTGSMQDAGSKTTSQFDDFFAAFKM